MFVPERIYIIYRNRTFRNLIFFFCRRNLNSLLCSVLFFLLFRLCWLYDRLDDRILVGKLILFDRVILRLCSLIV